MGALGISDTDHVVIYDTHGLFSAPRAWWSFKLFGHAKVSILEGGLPKWVAEERAVYDTEVKAKSKFYKARRPDPSLIRTLKQMISNTDMADQNPKEAEQVIDARPADRFVKLLLFIGLSTDFQPGLSQIQRRSPRTSPWRPVRPHTLFYKPTRTPARRPDIRNPHLPRHPPIPLLGTRNRPLPTNRRNLRLWSLCLSCFTGAT